MNGIQYASLYAGALMALIWCVPCACSRWNVVSALLLHTMAAIGVFFLLSGWRLSTVLLVLSEDKRERVTYWDETPISMLHYLLFRPAPGWNRELSAASAQSSAN